ncbi:MAG: DUF3052 domain-containing protein [Chthoniobacterales bacterium]
MPGYSGTPLVRKLGLKQDEKIVVRNAPSHYGRLLVDRPAGTSITRRLTAGAKFVHLFVTRRRELEREAAALRTMIDEAGVLWVSWPKKAAGVPTDVTENIIREVMLPLGFVDVKVCAVDETWSGLKLMIRREYRTTGARQ